MKFILLALIFLSQNPKAFAADANSCLDQDSLQTVGLALAMADAKGALPEAQGLETKIVNEKFHRLTKIQKFWNPDQADYLSFDIIVGTPSSNAPGGFRPAVAYSVKVDTSCRASTELDYTIE